MAAIGCQGEPSECFAVVYFGTYAAVICDPEFAGGLCGPLTGGSEEPFHGLVFVLVHEGSVYVHGSQSALGCGVSILGQRFDLFKIVFCRLGTHNGYYIHP